ncbi:hypothetical protein [Oryza sativa Japonica Group]|uniref:Uncharacterized protein P0025A05.11 n=1 Tax=Oryza sativa subsp. japonica TaxID=39947 RepID=Q94D24_ORYSJ|nr:hypothetical protein [Oryza sativa Japonica Group]
MRSFSCTARCFTPRSSPPPPRPRLSPREITPNLPHRHVRVKPIPTQRQRNAGREGGDAASDAGGRIPARLRLDHVVEGVSGRGGVGASGEEGLGAAEEGSGEDDDGGGAVLMLAPRRERGERSGDWLLLLAPRRSSSSSTVPGLSPSRWRGTWRGWEWERRPTAAASGELLLLPSSPATTPPSTAGSLPGPLP